MWYKYVFIGKKKKKMMNIMGVLFERLICLILFEYLRKYLGGEFFGKKLM